MNPRLKEDVVLEDLAENESIAVSKDGEIAIVMNTMAAFICELCDGSRDVEAIVAEICNAMEGAEPEQVRTDVDQVLRSLAESGVIEVE